MSPSPPSPPPPSSQRAAHAASLASPSTFWASEAQHLDWATPPQQILQHDAESQTWSWCADGQLSASHNLLGRHVLAGRGADTAVVWDSPVTGAKRRISYMALLEDVEVLAGVMAKLGVGVGDRVLIYMPMIPEAVVGMLACTHLGAVHSVVFGGFAPAECAKRIEAAEPVLILTASCGIEGSSGGQRKIIPYLPFVREAIQRSTFKPRNTILFERPEFFQRVEKSRGELQWNQLVRSQRVRRGKRGVPLPDYAPSSSTSFTTSSTSPTAPSTPHTPPNTPASSPTPNIETGAVLPGSSPHYIIYTSGTTGTPKGVLRPLAGHLLGLSYTIRHLFSIRGPGDVIFTASDLGWVVGHSYILYAPLLVGATTVLFEGKPVNTPDASTFWRVCEEHKVNALFTAPSALRAISREDPDAHLWEGRDLRMLRGIFLAGERSEPTIVRRYQELLEKHAAPGAMVIDNYWSSESGSPITGLFFSSASSSPDHKPQPGSCGLPLPGWDLRIVDDAGRPVPAGQMGNIVLAPPLGPTGFTCLHGDPARSRFLRSYLARFSNRWLDTGDAGVVDSATGYVTVLSRTDDVLNVAAHRLSSSAIEGAVVAAPGVAEAYVVPVADEMKGQVPVAFVVLKGGATWGREVEERVRASVRNEVGPIAALKAVLEIPAAAVPRTRSGKVMRRAFRGLVEGRTEACPEGVEERVWDGVREKVRAVLGVGVGGGVKAKL